MIIPRGRNASDSAEIVWIPGSDDLPGDAAGTPWTYVVGQELADRAGIRQPKTARVRLARFGMHVRPVSNRAYARFVTSESFHDRAFWTAAFPLGTPWPFGEREAPPLPRSWRGDPEGHRLAPELPVLGVTWYEALAYARFVGGRLPSEVEWEVAASCHFVDPPRRHRYPWGDGDGGKTFGELFGSRGDAALWNHAPLVASTRNPTTACEMMLGFHWEWTADGYDEARYAGQHDGVATMSHAPEQVVAKGGSPCGYAGDPDCASRFAFAPDLALAQLSFRCVFDGPAETR